MSLKDPAEEYDDLLPEKPSIFNFSTKKIKIPILILIIGIIIGMFFTHYYIEPFFQETSINSNCSSCIQTKEALNKENECLYELLNNAKDINQCVNQNNLLNNSTID